MKMKQEKITTDKAEEAVAAQHWKSWNEQLDQMEEDDNLAKRYSRNESDFIFDRVLGMNHNNSGPKQFQEYKNLIHIQ